MKYLLDTNAFSDLMRKRATVEARLTSLDPADVVGICSVVHGEIRYGVRRLADGNRRE